MSNTTIKVALDWTPNTIHSGLFVALEKGFYKEQGLDVKLLAPDANYSQTPAKLLENGEVDLAICPSESCIAHRESEKMHLQAIYAILQQDASAIVTCRPEYADIKTLEKATYGSYNARYEDHIVRAMVNNGGGDGTQMKIKSSAGKLTLFDELQQGAVDATWVFMPWEGVEADQKGTKLNVFKTEAYGIPYGYSPVIARNAGSQNPNTDALRKFVAATRRDYEHAIKSPDDVAATLAPHCRPQRSVEFLTQSQRQINGFYDDEGRLGSMDAEKWSRWIEWLKSQDLLKSTQVAATDLFTNEFFA